MQSLIHLTPILQKAGENLLAGDLCGARQLAEAALAVEAENSESLHLLALVLARSGDFSEAAKLLSRALEREPHRPTWHRDLGTIHSAANRWREASEAFARARQFTPNDADLLALHAEALLKCGRPEEARDVYQQARSLAPDSTTVLEGLGRAWAAVGCHNEAIEALHQCLERSPQTRGAHELLAEINAHFGHYHRAREHRQAVVGLSGEDLLALAELARAHWEAGDVNDSLRTSRQVINAGYGSDHFHSFYLYSLLFDPAQLPGMLRDAHEAWAKAHCKSDSGSPVHTNVPDPDRRLRIGYLSGDFDSGPAFHFLFPFLRNHDREQVEVFCYHTRRRSDNCTAQIREIAQHWRDAHALTEAEIIRSIRADEIDILVDLSGHFPDNRLKVFHARPAPIEVTFPNYPSTTGVSAIDYILTDHWICPKGSEAQYTEEVVRLPNGYLAYGPASIAPDVSPLPALSDGTVTFGLFQTPAKINFRVWDAVAEVLRRCPNSRILIHHGAQEVDVADSAARQRTIDEFESRGISKARIAFRGLLPFVEHLALLGEADIALDTFPYNGQTTTCECLWMGVPVVTIVGQTHVARIGYAVLRRVSLEQFVAQNVEEYVETAVRLSSDLVALANLRSELRSHVGRSCLVDGPAVTRDIEAAYRWMWRRWCAARKE